MYNKLDNSLSNEMTDSTIMDIIYSLYNNDYTNELDNIESEIDMSNQNNVKIIDEVRKKLLKKFYKTKSIKMGFGKAPTIKNSNSTSFTYSGEILDDNEDIKKIFATQYNDKQILNYYKK
jgi:hypothetical protein